jgi:hypothetical protein
MINLAAGIYDAGVDAMAAYKRTTASLMAANPGKR